MRIINPSAISGKILSLIEETDKELIIVSPGNDFGGHGKLFEPLKKATGRGIKVSFIVEKDALLHKSFSELKTQIYYVEKLYTKIYINEKQAILTSINLADDPDRLDLDFGTETDNAGELEEVKKTYLSFIRKDIFSQAYNQNGSFEEGRLKKPPCETAWSQDPFTNSPPEKMRSFEAHFQKTFRRHNLIYHEERQSISCNNFPFEWTNFEYSETIKISFLSPSIYNYRKFRHETIEEFNHLFESHKTCWSYPYDSISICGDEAANGINPNDIHSQVAYTSWLIEEVIKFFQTKEDVLLHTPLYKFPNYAACQY